MDVLAAAETGELQRILTGAAIPSNGAIVDPYEFLPIG